ncbi:MAG: DUF2291 family protein [Pararhizobium sp.]
MSNQSAAAMSRSTRLNLRWVLVGIAVVVLLVAMALDTKVVKMGAAGLNAGVFSPEAFGESEFPKVQAEIEKRAVDAATLADAIAKDQTAAAKKYGVDGTIGPEMSVKFTGVVGDGSSGIYKVKVPGVPDDLTIRVQTGPAINGTDIRDATGTIKFGQFKNQIEYQNAGSALNNAVKKQVLSKVDTKKLTGKTVSVTGAFTLINPKNWLVTPVRLSVQ